MTSAEYQQIVEYLERQFTEIGRRFGEVDRRFDRDGPISAQTSHVCGCRADRATVRARTEPRRGGA